MPDLTPEEIGALLVSLGLPADPTDLPEVAHRVNAVNEALSVLDHPDLDTTEPASVFWLKEEG
jgi:hypothetical protein